MSCSIQSEWTLRSLDGIIRSMRLVFTSPSESHTIHLGQALGRVLRAGDILALDGELGAGKTRLVRGIALGIHLSENAVSSPTYVLIHEYLPDSPLQPPLFHVDAYRLNGPDELDSIGWDRVVDGLSVVVIEWAARIWQALATEPSLGRIQISTDSPDHRTIELIAPDGWILRPEWNQLASLANRSSDGKDGPPPDRCPTCGVPSAPEALTFPFCNERCRMADLGRWFSGHYIVSRDLAPDDVDDPDLQSPRPVA